MAVVVLVSAADYASLAGVWVYYNIVMVTSNYLQTSIASGRGADGPWPLPNVLAHIDFGPCK